MLITLEMKTLSLDLGTNTGWAFRDQKGKIKSGSISFQERHFDSKAVKYIKFNSWLSLIHTNEHFDFIAYEAVRRHLGSIAAHAYGGFLAVLQMFCEKHRIDYIGYPVKEIKKHITGKGNANKEQVITAVKELGHNPRDDDEADAISILYLAEKYHVHIKDDNLTIE